MKWRIINPTKQGKYIVETKTTMGKLHRIEATYTPDIKEPTRGSWSFTNQTFVRWLDETKTQTVMVAIPVDPYHNSRKVCEFIQNEVFNSTLALREYLNKELEVDEDNDDELPAIYDLNYFMDECNDQEFNLENYFISYVQIVIK
jgi:hypothetical protein